MSRCGRWIYAAGPDAEDATCNREAGHPPHLPCVASPETYDRAHNLVPQCEDENPWTGTRCVRAAGHSGQHKGAP